MKRFRYPANALIGDYLRAGIGLTATAGPVVVLETALPVTVVLGCFSILFTIFGLRTALRQSTVIEMSDDAIAMMGKGGKRLEWRDVRELRLDYYSTRRDREGGWMQMKISGPDGHIRIDSALDGFHEAVNVAARRAAACGIRVTATTNGNLQALGIEIPALQVEVKA
jgi:hypothetical protein